MNHEKTSRHKNNDWRAVLSMVAAKAIIQGVINLDCRRRGAVYGMVVSVGTWAYSEIHSLVGCDSILDTVYPVRGGLPSHGVIRRFIRSEVWCWQGW